ncbi:hypothetical protein ACFFWB_27435 [Flavobacterium procerum]|uniref:hypothetical protein n=1 Tax=Flavobacterium procerum TaxID=1455569 RepID=UPI0035F079AD
MGMTVVLKLNTQEEIVTFKILIADENVGITISHAPYIKSTNLQNTKHRIEEE